MLQYLRKTLPILGQIQPMLLGYLPSLLLDSSALILVIMFNTCCGSFQIHPGESYPRHAMGHSTRMLVSVFHTLWVIFNLCRWSYSTYHGSFPFHAYECIPCGLSLSCAGGHILHIMGYSPPSHIVMFHILCIGIL